MKPEFIRSFFIILFVTLSIAAKAQRGSQTSLSIETGIDIPLNLHPYLYDGPDVHIYSGVDIQVKLEKPLTTKLHFTASAGFMYYSTNYKPADSAAFVLYHTNSVNLGPYRLIPIKAGVKYYFIKYAYLSAEAGSAFKAADKSITSFIYSGGAGSVITMNRHSGFDFGLKFERGYKATDYNFVMNQVVFNAAYKYRF